MLRRIKAFMLSELLISLLVALSMLPLLLGVYEKLMILPYKYHDISAQLSIQQLRRLLLLAYDIEVRDESVEFLYREKTFSLKHHNNHLVLSPGTRVVYEDIDDACFFIEDGMIVMKIYKNNDEEEISLAKADSFSINTFLGSDNDNN